MMILIGAVAKVPNETVKKLVKNLGLDEFFYWVFL